MGAGKQEKWNKIILTSLCCLKTTTRPLVLLCSQQGGPVRVRFYLGNWYWFLVCRQDVGRKRFFNFFFLFLFFPPVSILMDAKQCGWTWDVWLRLAVCYHDWLYWGKKIFWIDLQTSCLAFAHLPSHVSCKAILKSKMKNPTHGCGKLFFVILWMNFEWLFSISDCPSGEPCVCSLGSSSQSCEGSALPWGCSECCEAPGKSQGKCHSSVGRNSKESSLL